MALTLVIIVCGERMSHSKPRKPLNFPQEKKSRTEKNGRLKREKEEEEDRWGEKEE